MITKRIIPCLDVKDGRVVKGQRFQNIKDVDCPVELAKFYSREGADELVFYDISASHEKRDISLRFVSQVADHINIPFSVGGGVKTLDDFDKILKSGADKVSINSSAVKHPQLIKEAASKYGNQCVVVSIDVKDKMVYMNGGRIKTGLNVIDWAKRAVSLGAGELVINSIDADGMKTGFDLSLLEDISKSVNVPIIASGGAGTMKHFLDASRVSDGLLAASVFHKKEIIINDLKRYLSDMGVAVRYDSSCV